MPITISVPAIAENESLHNWFNQNFNKFCEFVNLNAETLKEWGRKTTGHQNIQLSMVQRLALSSNAKADDMKEFFYQNNQELIRVLAATAPKKAGV